MKPLVMCKLLENLLHEGTIGEVFDGTISAVTAFGIFVALDAVYVEGLVHVSELGSDYFVFDNIKHQMLGERNGQRYRLGIVSARQAGPCRSGIQPH